MHLPGEAYVVTVVAFLQDGAGGELQVTFAHGFALQDPPAQPKAQLMFVLG